MECFECRFLKAPPFSNNAYRITLHSSEQRYPKNINQVSPTITKTYQRSLEFTVQAKNLGTPTLWLTQIPFTQI